jgi:hypothetical protein
MQGNHCILAGQAGRRTSLKRSMEGVSRPRDIGHVSIPERGDGNGEAMQVQDNKSIGALHARVTGQKGVVADGARCRRDGFAGKLRQDVGAAWGGSLHGGASEVAKACGGVE